MKIGLYTGRFQPFHLGHMEALKWIMSENDVVYVLVCSKVGESALDDRNPFTYAERVKMIGFGVPEDKLENVFFRHIKDQDNDKVWLDVINRQILEKGEMVAYSNNPNTLKAFKDHNFKTKKIPIKHKNLNATLIRKLIIRNDPEWKKLVPDGTRSIINEIRKTII